MFKLNDIKELIRAIDRSAIDELIIKGENNEKLVIRKRIDSEAVSVASKASEAVSSSPQLFPEVKEVPIPLQTGNVDNAQETPKGEVNLHKIVSPMVGTFYAAPAPDAAPYVEKGDYVKVESVVCIVEAMKLMNELEAEVNGEIVETLVKNGQLVEYGQPLFLVKVSE